MRIRRAAAAAVVPVSLLAFLTMSPTARAAAGAGAAGGDDPVSCTIVDTSPDVVSLGVTAKQVTFDVGTDCDDDTPISWALSSDVFPGSNGNSWLSVCNYSRPVDGQNYTCNPAGTTSFGVVGKSTFTGNAMARSHPLTAFAFNDADGDGRVDNGETSDLMQSSFRLVRTTTFGSSFNASPEPRKRGQTLTITGQLQRANWDTGRYEKFGAYVTLQFRPTGAEDYRDVKRVWDNGVSATTTVRAATSGTWRYHYAGDAVHAASNSKGDAVTVR
jgi:hypothetical protein